MNILDKKRTKLIILYKLNFFWKFLQFLCLSYLIFLFVLGFDQWVVLPINGSAPSYNHTPSPHKHSCSPYQVSPVSRYLFWALYSADKKLRYTIQITNDRLIHWLNYQWQVSIHFNWPITVQYGVILMGTIKRFCLFIYLYMFIY